MEATIRDQFEFARDQRLADGIALLESQPPRLAGGAYMLGYVAELALARMVIEVMKLSEIAPANWRLVYGAVRAKADQLGVRAERDGYHNPVFWAELLRSLALRIGDRSLQRRAARLVRDARQVQRVWSTDLRYEMRSVTPSSVEELRIFALRFSNPHR